MRARVQQTVRNKYFWMELMMICSITYFIAIFSDVEYSYYEEGSALKFIDSLDYRLVFGTFHFILYGTYYWGILKRFVTKRQPWAVAISVVIFVPIIHLYNHYVATWSASQLSFLSSELRALAASQFKSRRPYAFVYAYNLSLRCLPLIFFAYLVRSLRQESQFKALKEQQLLSELNYLKAQVQPHFFFNTLNNIYAMAIKQSPNTAPMVLQLSEMMRYILYKSSAQKVPLRQEIDFIQHYIEIERIRHQEYISIELDVDGDISKHEIEPLLLLPFIENAFKHGTHDSLHDSFVQIIVCVRGDELNLQVTNSKPAEKKVESSGGIGLINVKKRLDLTYINTHELHILESEKQYQVNLNLQLLRIPVTKLKQKNVVDLTI